MSCISSSADWPVHACVPAGQLADQTKHIITTLTLQVFVQPLNWANLHYQATDSTNFVEMFV